MNEKELLEENELKANRVMAVASLIVAAVLTILFFVTIFGGGGVFAFTQSTVKYVKITMPVDIALLIVPVFFLKTEIIKKSWFKYCLLGLLVLVVSLLNVILPKDSILLWAVIIAVASLYFNPRFTMVAFFLTIGLMLITTYLGMLVGSWENNMMGVNQSQFSELMKLDDSRKLDPNSTEDRLYWLNNFKEMIAHNDLKMSESNRWLAAFIFYFLPRALSVAVIAFLGNVQSKRSSHILNEQIKETKSVQKMTSELSIATQIQAGCLPKKFPDSKYGELYALMDPAKEVGGDFYDFFVVDEDNIAIAIGDASGKGVPASLFMMKAQSLIRALVQANKNVDVGQIMTIVNDSICEGNEMTMFVTCWLGIFNKKTGELRYSNAGHNPPIIKSNGEYKYLNAKPGLVLGGFPEFVYQEASVSLAKGDKLFLYTDGVTEAHNVKSELYGEKRLLEFIKKNDSNPKDTINKIRDDLREFSRNTEQFDDITMLMLEYRKPKFTVSKIFEAKLDQLEAVQEFIINSIKTELSMKDRNQLMIVVEEIFVNIASYSYKDTGDCEVDVNLDNGVLTLSFKDSGVQFNPLEKADPNTALEASERGIGGLGIYMVKNLMDKVFYEYVDGKNVLTLVKKY